MTIMLLRAAINSVFSRLKILTQPIHKEIELVFVLHAEGPGLGALLDLLGYFLFRGLFGWFLAVAKDAVLSL